MYVDGFVTPVPKKNKEKYLAHLAEAKDFMKDFGLVRMVECWQDDVKKGQQTDFFRAVEAKEDEAVLFSWFEWKSKEDRDVGMKKMMEDKRMENMEMPFDGKRMIYGGFDCIFDEKF